LDLFFWGAKKGQQGAQREGREEKKSPHHPIKRGGEKKSRGMEVYYPVVYSGSPSVQITGWARGGGGGRGKGEKKGVCL